MLFHTHGFILFFLLPLFGLFYLFAKKVIFRQYLLLIVSYGFYAYWDYRLLPLLLFSTGMNWFLAYRYQHTALKAQIYFGILVNLLLIAVFKYLNFFAESISWVSGDDFEKWDIILPLGISFFTFQQISYLIDLKHRKAVVHNLHQYALYVAFFPQLIAGPIVRHNELIDQFDADPKREGFYERLSHGMLFFILGMVKKVLLSDSAAATSNPLFQKALHTSLTFSESMTAVWAFTLQIYFDFSGYSDMAIGLALLFGVWLPYNFNSPYKAVSIQDFWRRWHMTLSRFLRDYLYIPLGGSYFGPVKQATALMITMLLGGLWHGASWNFVIWGGAHGLALAICSQCYRLHIKVPVFFSWLITFLFVSLAWVFFRAETFSGALNVYEGLIKPFDTAGWPVGKKQMILLFGTAIIFLLPASQHLITKYLKPYRVLALIFAGLFFLSFLRSGGVYYEDFIYFQF